MLLELGWMGNNFAGVHLHFWYMATGRLHPERGRDWGERAGLETSLLPELSGAAGFELKTQPWACNSQSCCYHIAWQPPGVALAI